MASVEGSSSTPGESPPSRLPGTTAKRYSSSFGHRYERNASTTAVSGSPASTAGTAGTPERPSVSFSQSVVVSAE